MVVVARRGPRSVDVVVDVLRHTATDKNSKETDGCAGCATLSHFLDTYEHF